MRPATTVVNRRRRRLTALLAIATVLTATASAVAATSAAPPPQVLNYQAYVGGKGKAKANLSPVVLGWINTQGGPPNATFPQVTDVARAAVRMINGELGGVHGHPVKLSECFIVQAEEEGVRCGQQMVNQKGMKAIVLGAQFTGNQSMYATVKGTIPVIGGVATAPADYTAKNAFFLNGSQTSVLGPFATYTKRFLPKVKTVAVVYPNQPGADTAGLQLSKAMEQLGYRVTKIATPQNATDLLGPATQASSADMIVPALGFTDCVPFARALDQIRYSKPVLTTPLCTFIPRGAYASGDLPGWTYGIAQTLVNLPGPQSKLYLKKGIQYGTSVANMVNAFGELAWEELLATVKIMNAIPFAKLSPATVTAGFKAFRGPLVLAAPEVACGKAYPGQPTVCGNQTQFYTYVGKGKWKVASGWLKGPAPK
jgi:branched-chain amino acid transport system substrate-binding protein